MQTQQAQKELLRISRTIGKIATANNEFTLGLAEHLTKNNTEIFRLTVDQLMDTYNMYSIAHNNHPEPDIIQPNPKPTTREKLDAIDELNQISYYYEAVSSLMGCETVDSESRCNISLLMDMLDRMNRKYLNIISC